MILTGERQETRHLWIGEPLEQSVGVIKARRAERDSWTAKIHEASFYRLRPQFEVEHWTVARAPRGQSQPPAR